MENNQFPHIDDTTVDRMSTASLIDLARWARAHYYRTANFSGIDLLRLYDQNRAMWFEHVSEQEYWRFLEGRCNSALTRRGVW